MRKAELIMAVVMAVFSAYLMLKSAELPIGWIPRRGPGAGAFPILAIGWHAAVLHLDHRALVPTHLPALGFG